MIVVAGNLADIDTALVYARLETVGLPYRPIDLSRYPIGYRLRWTWRGGGPEGWIETDDWRLDLADVSAAYIRLAAPEGHSPASDARPGAGDAISIEGLATILAMIDELPCLVVNRPASGRMSYGSLLRAAAIRAAGLATPSTLVTNDAAEARRFYDEHGGDVIRLTGGGWSTMTPSGDEPLELPPRLGDGPARFQQWIPGEDVRVHTVGDEVIATRVRSAATDVRSGSLNGHAPEMEPTAIPPAVAAACLRLGRSLDLPLAGIDLRETPDGRHFCVGIHPTPDFGYYELQTGQPITHAIADLLDRGTWAASGSSAYAMA